MRTTTTILLLFAFFLFGANSFAPPSATRRHYRPLDASVEEFAAEQAYLGRISNDDARPEIVYILMYNAGSTPEEGVHTTTATIEEDDDVPEVLLAFGDLMDAMNMAQLIQTDGTIEGEAVPTPAPYDSVEKGGAGNGYYHVGRTRRSVIEHMVL